MTEDEILGGMQAMLDKMQMEKRKVEYSYQVERLERKVKDQQEQIDNLHTKLETVIAYIKTKL